MVNRPDPAALAELRRLEAEATPGPWLQVEGMVAFGPLDVSESRVCPALIVEMRNALPVLLALAERVADIDPALLDRVAARYIRDEVDLCPTCGKTLREGTSVWSDGSAPMYCPDHPDRVMRLLNPGDADVMRLVTAIRGKAVTDAK